MDDRTSRLNIPSGQAPDSRSNVHLHGRFSRISYSHEPRNGLLGQLQEPRRHEFAGPIGSIQQGLAQSDGTMMPKLRCPRTCLEETLGYLRAGGALNCETMVLWLGAVRDGCSEVREVYRPEQKVDFDYFHIPPESMRAVMGRIRETRFQILAQVHSHPEKAFHSRADDTRAIVRHVGAISIVIPHFAYDTMAETFGDQAASYRLDSRDSWEKVSFTEVVEVV